MSTADPIARGLRDRDFPRTIRVTDSVDTYEDFHAGPEKFTTTNIFVVTADGVLVADGQGSVAQATGLVDAIRTVTPQPIKYVVVASDHGDHTAGNTSFPAGVTYIIHFDVEGHPRACAARVEAAGQHHARVGEHSMRLGGEDFDHPLPRARAYRRQPERQPAPPEDSVLSETFLNRVCPAMRSAYPGEWLKALDRAEAMKADIYIAGQGFTERGPVSNEEIRAYHKALEAVIVEATRRSATPACRSRMRSGRPSGARTPCGHSRLVPVADRWSKGVQRVDAMTTASA